MRLLRIILFSAIFLIAVILASANIHTVNFVYLPDLPLVAGEAGQRSMELPLFLLVLGALMAGILTGAAGALFEQIRLRSALRRVRKERKQLAAELAKASTVEGISGSEPR